MYKLFLLILFASILFLSCKEEEKYVIDKNQFTSVPIEGFIGIKWGDSRDSVILKLQERDPYNSLLISDNPFILNYHNSFELQDYKISSLTLWFSSQGFSSALAVFYDLKEPELHFLFNKLKESIIIKYDKPYRYHWNNVAWQSKDSCEIILDYSNNANAGSISYSNHKMDAVQEAEEKAYKQEQEKIEAQKKISDL